MQIKLLLPDSTDGRFCNAFRVYKSLLPGHCAMTFGFIDDDRVLATASFCMENGHLLGMKANLLNYLASLRAAQGLPEFSQPKVDMRLADPPRAVDHLVMSQRMHAAEFAFYTWSWAATQMPPIFSPEQNPAEKTISAFLHPVIRCTASLQIAFLEELYDDSARNKDAPFITFEARPPEL
jgi:hypothetical protein